MTASGASAPGSLTADPARVPAPMLPAVAAPPRAPALLDATAARALLATYPPPSAVARGKDIGRIDGHLRGLIEAAPLCCIASASADGRQDVTPRGDVPGAFKVLDEHTLALPDRPGNNRADTLGNLVENPHVGLIFLIPGVDEAVRVNGMARLSVDPELLASMAVDGRPPRVAIVVEVREAFLHCGKALRRARLWDAGARRRRDDFAPLARMLAEQLGLAPAEAEALEARTARGYRDGLWAALP